MYIALYVVNTYTHIRTYIMIVSSLRVLAQWAPHRSTHLLTSTTLMSKEEILPKYALLASKNDGQDNQMHFEPFFDNFWKMFSLVDTERLS